MSAPKDHKTIHARGHTSKPGYARIGALLKDCAALQHRRDAFRHSGQYVSYFDQCQQLTGLRKDDDHWNGLHLLVARGVIKRVDRAYQSFF